MADERRDRLLATNGRLLYLVCKRALRESDIQFRLDEPAAVLVWCDSIKAEFFQAMRPWQVINRLPWAKVMCRKAPFVRLVHRIAVYFPSLFTFLPKSYVLPEYNEEFKQALSLHDKTYIYKPDKGSLGHGIRVISPSETFEELNLKRRLAVAQEYIDSFLIDDRKFDLRIYALVASLQPLRIYVSRKGVARFCTESADGGTKYSVLTNTALNKKNPDRNPDPEEMTRMVSEVMDQIHCATGCDIDALWESIENAIGLTIISAYGFLIKAEAQECPSFGYPRCFQIIGVDVLLDRDLRPFVLEINYRPSLKSPTLRAQQLKQAMLKDALRLGCPYQPIQQLIFATPDVPDGFDEFRRFMEAHEAVIRECEEIRAKGEIENSFVLVYPDPRRTEWDSVIQRVQEMPSELTMIDKMPLALHGSKPWGSRSFFVPEPQRKLSKKRFLCGC
jgi:hypothetical protein